VTRRWLAPEVIQTSAMDCGPASLKCLLEGFGIPVSYGRLREACQTDVDGTSIDTLEELLPKLGLHAEQMMVPVDHVLRPEAGLLPGVAVVRQPNGFTHFVVIWRTHGPIVQIMDPASGRRWQSREELVSELYVHTARVPASSVREWTASEDFTSVLRARLRELGCEPACRGPLEAAQASPEWRPIAAFDAAVRMTATLVRGGGFARGAEAARALLALYERALAGDDAVPAAYWTVQPAPADTAEPDDDGEQVLLRGAVVVRVRRPDASIAPSTTTERPSPELVAALAERPPQAWRTLAALLWSDGVVTVPLLATALVAAVSATALEAVLFRGFFGAGRALGLVEQRLFALGAFVLFALVLLSLELSIQGSLARLGRRLEVRLRMAFLAKIPRLGDRYFQSRPTSDMAERSHAIHEVRSLPDLGAQIVRSTVQLVVTTSAIAWIDPPSAPWAVLAAITMVAIPLAAQPALLDRDARARSHLGALSRSYLDVLLGLVPVRTHGAERSVRREHEGLLVEWTRAAHATVRVLVATDALQTLTAFAITVAIVLGYAARATEPAAVLLLVYWVLDLPALGDALAVALRRYPAQRNRTLRLLEPLGAPEEGAPAAEGAASDAASVSASVGIVLEAVSVIAGGHTILDRVDLTIRAGEHVAIVGASGAGKSSLVGLLLGWHRATGGRVVVDGRSLTADGSFHEALRARTAWVDPSIQLWNRSLLENLDYGTRASSGAFAPILEKADLHALIEALPDGLQTPLGESGGLVSGGEGQRVRLGRAFGRRDAALVILDEPFRGLDRTRRTALLAIAREWWKDATILCVTHDVAETQSFERVLVIDQGRVIEEGAPAELGARPGSAYRTMLDTEAELRTAIWGDDVWRRVRIEGGKLVA
jgi:ABC-type bacteriocin/lantibiotic exporter with double-glycine peptidase domain